MPFAAELIVNDGNVEFRVSPGTKASDAKMQRKLASLRQREATRKEAVLGWLLGF